MFVWVVLVFAVIGVANERKDHDDDDDGRDDANDNHNDDN